MKKLVALLCVAMLTLSMSLPVFAADGVISPISTPDNSGTTGDNKSPQTGEENVVLYTAGAVVVLAGVAVVAKKKLSAE